MLEYDRKERKRLQEFWDTAGRSEQPKPKCPTCGSTDLRKVSVGAKTVSVGLFGIFSQKVKRLGIVTAVDMNGNAAQRGVGEDF